MIRYSFNPISEIFIQPSHLLKYLWNPITEIFVQSKNGNLCSIHSWTYLFNPFENTFNPSDISFNLPGASAVNLSWLGERKLVVITMAMAEVDTFHLKVIFQRFLRSFLQKAETHLTEGSLRYEFGGAYIWRGGGGAYTWRGLFSEFYGTFFRSANPYTCWPVTSVGMYVKQVSQFFL